jgi:uncharacterized membrane protein YtjA (UPF0391 family)
VRDWQDAKQPEMPNSLEVIMLYWALVFLVVALVAGVLGFGGVAGASASIAQVLFFIFLIALAFSVVSHFVRRT